MFRFLRTEPAAVAAAVVACFTLLAAVGVDIPGEASTATAAAIPVVMAAALAGYTRPVKVPLIVAGVVEVFVLAAAWGVDLPGGDDAAFVNGLAGLLTAGGALLVRMGVVPAGGPVDGDVLAGVVVDAE